MGMYVSAPPAGVKNGERPSISAGPSASSTRRQFTRALAIAAIYFVAVAPTLNWAEFYQSMENLNISTVLEIHRDGHWAIPTLNGTPRIVKPPLTAWSTALTVSPSTVRALSSPDPQTRQNAYRSITFQARWFALLCAAAMLVATFDLAKTLGDDWIAPAAAVIAGSTIFFLRFSRLALTDVHLALWVTVANAFLARAIFRRQRWTGCAGAGAALGLALMSKGPVALLQSIVPCIAFLLYCRYSTAADPDVSRNSPEPRRTAWPGPIILGAVLMLALWLPWYLYVISRLGEQWRVWFQEITGDDGPTSKSPDGIYLYVLFLLGLMLPWTIFWVAGIADVIGFAVARLKSRRQTAQPPDRLLLALFLVFIPVFVMCFFKLKKDRYLLPMIPSAAILAAAGVRQFFALRRARGDAPSVFRIDIPHWILLAVFVVIVPLGGAMGWVRSLRTPDNQPAYTAPVALLGGGVLAIALIVALRNARRGPGATILGTASVMLLLQAFFFAGFARSDAGHSGFRPIAEKLWTAYPSATYCTLRKPPPEDLSIYLNFTLLRHTQLEVQQLADSQPARPVIVTVEEDNSSHTFLPPNWMVFDRVHRGHWYAFYVVPPSSAKMK